MSRLVQATTIVSAALLSIVSGVVASAPAATATETPPAKIIYAAPEGTGPACSRGRPCSLEGAQQRVRHILGTGESKVKDVVVELADGTYRLSAPLQFGPLDSGRDGHRVIWTAALGAHPVLSGAEHITGWQLHDVSKNIWQAPVPASLNTRQLYVNGQRVPIAQTTPAEQQLDFAAASGGYTTTPASWGSTLQSRIGADNLPRVEFVYTGGNGPWTQSRCRIASVNGPTVLMQQPCWDNVTKRPTFRDASGGLPSMSPGTAPTRIENAYPFLHPGQWYLDRDRHVLDYIPADGQDMATIDVEAPRLTSLVTGAGTLSQPVQNISFSGLQFSYATWLDPSTNVGFADVQDNLRLTGSDPSRPQATCTFGTPPGTCPFGSLTREPGNVHWSAAHNITFEGNTFTHLGAAGLVFDYGSRNNRIEGNTFTEISGNAIILGNTTDPHPADVGADDREINVGNTIDNNAIHDIGVDYPSAAGITLFFTQHTTVTHNDLYDLPYTGITAGVIQGHVDNADHPENTTNINSDNTISDNLIHAFMQTLHDGGAIYVEGHQGQTITEPDGSVDRVASIAHGLTVEGNVAYDQGNSNFTWYDDAGSQWINWTGNVEWGGAIGQGGCQSTGHLNYTGNASADPIAQWACSPPAPVDTYFTGNTTLPARPGAADLPHDVLANAGLTGRFRALVTAAGPRISYLQSPVTGTASVPVTVLVAGDGFTPDAQVSFAGTAASSIDVLSTGFLTATAPAGANPCRLTVTTDAGKASAKCPPVNVAQGKPAAQSSTWVLGDGTPLAAGNAVDGSLGDFADTLEQAQPWWQVDLGTSYPIDQIAVYNRTDCCQDRDVDYYVIVSDTPFTGDSLADALAQPGAWVSHQSAQAGRPTTIDVGGHTGRYVRVQLAGTNQLALAEVQVLSG